MLNSSSYSCCSGHFRYLSLPLHSIPNTPPEKINSLSISTQSERTNKGYFLFPLHSVKNSSCYSSFGATFIPHAKTTENEVSEKHHLLTHTHYAYRKKKTMVKHFTIFFHSSQKASSMVCFCWRRSFVPSLWCR